MSKLTHSLVAAIVLAACSRSDANATSGTSASAAGSLAAASASADSVVTKRADRGRILGDTTAKLWVIMASDFQCPYCKQWHDARFSELMSKYVNTGRVRLGFINFPLSQHQNALPAAEAGMCAAAQNKFLPMHEALFATQPKWENLRDPKPMFDSIATAVGVNKPAYRECVDKHLTLPLIEADHDRWASTGINSTPTFFVGGRQVPGGADADVGAAIDAALGVAKKSS